MRLFLSLTAGLIVMLSDVSKRTRFFADIRPETEKKCCVLSLKNTYVFIFCGKKVINKEKEGFLFAVTLAKIISDD